MRRATSDRLKNDRRRHLLRPRLGRIGGVSKTKPVITYVCVFDEN